MKIIRVDMTTKTVRTEGVPEKYMGLGGRGITSVMIDEEVPVGCDPLGAENRLIFAPGLLSGTSLVNTSRISIGSKSPLTGGVKESNAGGTAGTALGRLGITAVVIEGRAPAGEWFILRIDRSGAAGLEDAGPYERMRTYDLAETLLKRYGNENAVLCIGPAGEYLLRSASIQSSDVEGRTCRSAARGGLGAVMGAKGLKALMIDQKGADADPIKDPDAFRKAARIFAQAVRDAPFTKQLREFGTASLVTVVNSMGAFPALNATQGVMEGWEKVSGEALTKVIHERGGRTGHRGCRQCSIQCSNIYVDREGKYVTGSLEYETIWSMGGMTGIADLDTIARLDFLCDDIGIDTINTGVALAVAMDAGYRRFGDGQAAIEMIEEIGRGTEIGRVLGDGPVATGRHFNHSRIPAVKGQSISAYDPRAMQAYGVTYATSPMGADHTAGSVLGDYLSGALSLCEERGLVEASRNSQIGAAVIDNSGLCHFAAAAFAAPEAVQAFVEIINAKLGTGFDLNVLMSVGIRILKAERAFNNKAGFTSEDDRLPEFFSKEPLLPHKAVFVMDSAKLDETLSFLDDPTPT